MNEHGQVTAPETGREPLVLLNIHKMAQILTVSWYNQLEERDLFAKFGFRGITSH